MSTAISVSYGKFGRVALYRLDRPLITHAHRESQLVFHVSGGHSKVAIYENDHVVNDQHAVAVSPLEPHALQVNASQSSVVLMVYLRANWVLENCQCDDFPLRFGAAHIDRTPVINDLVHRLTTLLLGTSSTSSTSSTTGTTNVNSLLFSLAKVCYEQTWQSNKARSSLKGKPSDYSDSRIQRSLQLMQRSLSAEIELETVAREVGLSRPHFFKLFKKQMGVTPNIYWNTLRSERAIDELINTEKTVTDIASDLGYASQASFTRFFVTNVGIAPSEYRRAIESNSELRS